MKKIWRAVMFSSLLITCCIAVAADPVRIENFTNDLVDEIKDALEPVLKL